MCHRLSGNRPLTTRKTTTTMQHRPKTRLTVLSAMVLAMLLGPSTGAMADGWGKNPPSANEHSVTYDMSTLINLVDALS
ncbi:MAG: hypothetical protein OER12_10110, partial [Acidimicrobiia bacterium]|nr:hypothetical protein [Acidimicrobiia bacterium]